jgi:hypothetical protein
MTCSTLLNVNFDAFELAICTLGLHSMFTPPNGYLSRRMVHSQSTPLLPRVPKQINAITQFLGVLPEDAPCFRGIQHDCLLYIIGNVQLEALRVMPQ